MLKEEEILSILKETGALLKGHFQLSSGLHSPDYIQCALALSFPDYASQLASSLSELFQKDKIELVIGPALGGIVLSQEVGRALGRRAIFTEREGGKLRLRRGFSIEKGERVLVVEDVVTTGGSVRETMETVRKEEGTVVAIGCLVDRSGGKADFGARWESLLKIDLKTYLPEECPLCRENIPLDKPGSR